MHWVWLLILVTVGACDRTPPPPARGASPETEVASAATATEVRPRPADPPYELRGGELSFTPVRVDADAFERTLRAAFPRFRRCYALDHDAPRAAIVTLAFALAPTRSTPSGVELTADPTSVKPPVLNCMRGAVEKLRFAAAEDTSVRYELYIAHRDL
ncbi:MAG: hypothetical protein AAGA56_05025 [Myxococcota bacterium]